MPQSLQLSFADRCMTLNVLLILGYNCSCWFDTIDTGVALGCIAMFQWDMYQFWSPLFMTEVARHSFSLRDQGSVGAAVSILCSAHQKQTMHTNKWAVYFCDLRISAKDMNQNVPYYNVDLLWSSVAKLLAKSQLLGNNNEDDRIKPVLVALALAPSTKHLIHVAE